MTGTNRPTHKRNDTTINRLLSIASLPIPY
ncbi:hypothetical protein [Vibrio phage 27Ua.3]|nr:hypothetical protein [Vibrio phage 27Ua.3]